MKIVFFFMDMLRPDILNIVNPQMHERKMDRSLKKIGGTVYTNCYTPAPDTPRSLACLWSGKYPSKNGCNYRTKYPSFYMENDSNNILSELRRLGYEMNFFMETVCRKVGMLPPEFMNSGNHSGDCRLDEYLSKLHCADDSCTFISIEDFHRALDDVGANKQGVDLGCELLTEDLELIDAFLHRENIDVLILFSDHGFKYQSEVGEMNGFSLLSSDRTKVYLQIKTKMDSCIRWNSQITSIMDVYPYVLDIVKNDLDGDILLSERDFVLLEDHKNFNTELGQTIEYWGVVDSEGYSTIGCDGVWKSSYNMSEEKKKKYELELANNMSCFSENRKAYEILQLYKECEMVVDTYANGKVRNRVNRNSIAKEFDNKYKLYYYVMDCWMRLRQRGRSIEEYFIKRGFNRIAIYGMAELGITLYRELRDSSVEVVYGIDRAAERETEGLSIKRLEEELPRVDAIVVTALFSFEAIEQEIRSKGDYVVINFQEVILDLQKDG